MNSGLFRKAVAIVVVGWLSLLLPGNVRAQEPLLTNAWWSGTASNPTLHLQYDMPVGGQGWIEDWRNPPLSGEDNWIIEKGGTASEWSFAWNEGWINVGNEEPLTFPLPDGAWKIHDVYGDTYHNFTVSSGMGGQIGNFPVAPGAEVPEPNHLVLITLGLLTLLGVLNPRGRMSAQPGCSRLASVLRSSSLVCSSER